jgi:LPS export ABC transporter permease LptG
MARQGRLGAGPAVWLGNAVFLLAGSLLLWRVDRMPIEIGSVAGLWQRLKRRVQSRRERRRVVREESGRPRIFANFDFPQILDDYVLREFTKNFALMLSGLIVLLLVFTLFELLQDIFRNRVPAVTIVEYLVNVIPYFVYQLTPLVVLLAVLVTFSGMTRTNEVTAMKATGISVYRAVFPVLATAALFGLGLFLFEQYYLPYANTRQETLRSQIKGKPAQTYLRPDRKWIFGQTPIIYFYEFYDPAENQFAGVSAFGFDPETFAITRRIYANRAHWEPRLEKWIFENGWARTFAGARVTEFRTFDVNTFAEVTEPPRYFEKEVRLSSEMNYAELRRYIRDLQQSGFDVVRLRVQLHNKIAYPAITLVMAVLAVPFALSVGRRGALAGVAAAVGIAIGYMLIFRLFEVLGNVQYLPPALAAWSPDLIFGFAAGYLLLKVPT